jgi:hypothetical protein
VKSPEWQLDISGPKGQRLVYLGVDHQTDPKHPQFAKIQASWDALKPAIAFFEGPDRGVAETAENTILKLGESGLVRFLAKRDGAHIRTLEPPVELEMDYLRRRFGNEKLALFILLRETVRLRERKGLAPDKVKAEIGILIARASKRGLFCGAIANLEELDAAYRRHWSQPSSWLEAPERWIGPFESDAETGGVFTHAVNRASSEFRDAHMAGALVEAVRTYGRVFAVVGANHVPMQAAAIRCSLSSP